MFSDLGDTLSCTSADAASLSISGPFSSSLGDVDTNLVMKAYRLAMHAETWHAGPCPPLAFHLEKNLPVAAGIGGGSANAAAALRLMQHYMDLPNKTWRDIALKIGSDVPVCLLSQTSRMTGTGESVTTMPGLGYVYAVLVNPGVEIMTGDIFRAYDAGDIRGTPRPQKSSGTLIERALDGRNDLEAPAIAAAPILKTVLAALNNTNQCQLARMSGSGATCFGIYQDAASSRGAAAQIEAAYPAWWVKVAKFGGPQ